MPRAVGPLAAACVAGILTASAMGATPAQIVARLNAERIANGIPGSVALDAAWTLGCEHHVRYEELNGIGWTHEEVAGKPGFTDDGRLAGLEGDQADTGGWDSGDPYENLPLHLANLLAPSLQRIGVWDDGRRTCVQIEGASSGSARPIATDRLYAAPGPGRSDVPTSQVVRNEDPASPGDVVGLPQGTTTGPTVYLFAAGPWAESPLHVVAATLTGPSGPVAVKVVDPSAHTKIRGYTPPGVFFLIPARPLAPGTTYRATATIAGQDDALTKTWSFHTA